MLGILLKKQDKGKTLYTLLIISILLLIGGVVMFLL